MLRIGIDTGGTFTDCVLIDDNKTRMVVAKVPSQPGQPEHAILDPALKLLTKAGATAAIFDAAKRFERKKL